MEIEAIIQRIWERVTIYGIKVIATIAVVELADNSVNFVFRPWANASDYWNVWFDLTEKVKKRFDEAGISIPYPQRDIHVYEHKD